MAQVEEALASGGLARALGSGCLRHRNVDHAEVGHADEELEQDLEPDRTELDPVDQGAAAEEIAGEGVGALPRLLEQESRHHRRFTAHQAPHRCAEAFVAATRRVAARDHQVGAAFGLPEQHRNQLRGMLEVGVHDADVQAAGHVEPRDHCGAQPTLAVGSLAQQAADGRVGLGQVEEQIAGAVVAVVDEADFERGGGQSGGDPVHQGLDVVRLIARGYHQADDWRAATRPFGSHGQRIGANPWAGHRLSLDRSRAVTRGTPAPARSGIRRPARAEH